MTAKGHVWLSLIRLVIRNSARPSLGPVARGLWSPCRSGLGANSAVKFKMRLGYNTRTNQVAHSLTWIITDYEDSSLIRELNRVARHTSQAYARVRFRSEAIAALDVQDGLACEGRVSSCTAAEYRSSVRLFCVHLHCRPKNRGFDIRRPPCLLPIETREYMNHPSGWEWSITMPT